MKKQLVVAVLASLIPLSAVAALTYTPPVPGFYNGTHRLATADVQPFVNKNGAANIRFIPPSGPVVIRAVCGGIWYQYTYYPDAKGNAQLWQNANGQAMVNKIISSCK